jgi:hypothetical protein
MGFEAENHLMEEVAVNYCYCIHKGVELNDIGSSGFTVNSLEVVKGELRWSFDLFELCSPRVQ